MTAPGDPPLSIAAARAISWPRLAEAAVAILLAAPFFLFRDVPLLDLPVHIARQHILLDPDFAFTRAYYLPDWRPLPNLAMDIVVHVLHFAVTIDLAIRLFLALTALQLFFGAIALNRALFGSQARFGLYACLFVFNGPLVLGLVNFSFGIGLSLWVFALWIRRSGRRHSWILFAFLSSVILFAHLCAFAIYGLVVSAYALGKQWRSFTVAPQPRRSALRPLAVFLLKDLAHLLVPTGIYLTLMSKGMSNREIFVSTPHDKLVALVSMAGFYNYRFDAGCLAVLLLGLLLIWRNLILSRRMVLPLSALALAFVALPGQIGQATLVDYRIPAAAALFLVASIDWHASAKPRRYVDGFVAALFLLRMGVLFMQWAAWQPIYQEYRTAFRLLPPGARLLPIGTHQDFLAPTEHPPLSHMDALAVVERGAFIPTMLADHPSELLRYAPAVAGVHAAFWTSPDSRDYDYVLIVRPDRVQAPPGVTQVARGRDFILARVNH
jgi:hypothetical protein